MVLGVRFKEVGKIRYFSYDEDNDINLFDMVIAQTKRGIDCGKVVLIKKDDFLDLEFENDEKIIRKASQDDIKSFEIKKIEEKKAGAICKEKILKHSLNMKIIDVEIMFDRNKIIFYFVSDSRVDFRNLVKDLVATFKTRIELRQVGIRDEAKILGGIGVCGRTLCCTTFLNDFQNSTVKMAKDQGVSLNPIKLSGICARLKCCLKYEEDTYLELAENMPEVGSVLEMKDGMATVIARLPITNSLKVSVEDTTGNKRLKTVHMSEIFSLNKDEQNT